MSYFDLIGLSFHALKDLGTISPDFYYRSHVTKELGRTSSASMAFGTAVHAAVLEPDSYRELVTICPAEFLTPSGELSTKKEAKAWRETLPPYSCVLTPYDDARCRHIAAKVKANKHAAAILDGAITESEHTCDLMPGLTAKAKVDIITTKTATSGVWDFKTIKNLDDIAGHVADFAYLEQITWYPYVVTTATKRAHGAGGFIFAETEEPNRVAIVTASMDRLHAAAQRWQSWLVIYQECQASGVWPNDPTEPIHLT